MKALGLTNTVLIALTLLRVNYARRIWENELDGSSGRGRFGGSASGGGIGMPRLSGVIEPAGGLDATGAGGLLGPGVGLGTEGFRRGLSGGVTSKQRERIAEKQIRKIERRERLLLRKQHKANRRLRRKERLERRRLEKAAKLRARHALRNLVNTA